MTAVRSIKATVLVAFAGLVGGVSAIGLPSPNAEGKIVLDAEDGGYVATDDVICTQVVFSADNVSVDLSGGEGKKILLPSTVTIDGFAFSANDLSATIIGGVWDFGGNASMRVGIDYREGSVEFRGTKVGNVGGIVIGDGKKNCTLSLTEGAELEADSLRIASQSGHHCVFEILGGSKAALSAQFIPEEGLIGGAGGNLLRIDGEGSSLSVPNKSVLLGRGRSNDRMVVSGKATATFLDLSIGGRFEKDGQYAYATDTVMTVDDATVAVTEDFKLGGLAGGSTGIVGKATFTVGLDAMVGYGVTSSDNLLSVSGSVMTVGGVLSVGSSGSSGNRAEFRDTTLSARTIRVGLNENSVSNALVLAGNVDWTSTDTGVDDHHPFFFGPGGTNEVILTDGFRFEPVGQYVMSASGGNTIRVRNGANVVKEEGVWSIGWKDCHDNTYSAEAGGTTSVYRVYLSGERNRIVVSNGVFRVLRKTAESTGAMIVGSDSTDGDANEAVGCELVLCGTSPLYSSVGETKVCGNGKGIVRFVLPGAALETVPMSCGIITFNDGSVIQVDCDRYLSYIGTDRSSVVLARASRADRMVIPESVLAATNAGLPERCEVVVDGTDLVLKISGNKGTVVSVR